MHLLTPMLSPSEMPIPEDIVAEIQAIEDSKTIKATMITTRF